MRSEEKLRSEEKPAGDWPSREVGISQPTVHRHLALLEASYQLVRVPAYAINRTKRLIKSPKLYWSDVGLALHLAGTSEPGGLTWRI